MNKEYIEITELPKEGYKPLVDYESWRVAVLKYCDDVRPENIRTMQKHEQSDEVFVLLAGNCTLLCAGNAKKPGETEALKLQPQKIYNVKKGTWHNHTLDEQGIVLIVENRSTCDENSPICGIEGVV